MSCDEVQSGLKSGGFGLNSDRPKTKSALNLRKLGHRMLSELSECEVTDVCVRWS